jgi:hypothetical protein
VKKVLFFRLLFSQTSSFFCTFFFEIDFSFFVFENGQYEYANDWLWFSWSKPFACGGPSSIVLEGCGNKTQHVVTTQTQIQNLDDNLGCGTKTTSLTHEQTIQTSAVSYFKKPAKNTTFETNPNPIYKEIKHKTTVLKKQINDSLAVCGKTTQASTSYRQPVNKTIGSMIKTVTTVETTTTSLLYSFSEKQIQSMALLYHWQKPIQVHHLRTQALMVSFDSSDAPTKEKAEPLGFVYKTQVEDSEPVHLFYLGESPIYGTPQSCAKYNKYGKCKDTGVVFYQPTKGPYTTKLRGRSQFHLFC